MSSVAALLRVGHPRPTTPVGHVEAVPRRVRARLGDRTVLDTTAAIYLWEHPWYPQFYVPEDALDADVLAGLTEDDDGDTIRRDDALPGYLRVAWDALDAWFEEDEQVYVHPRSPFVRVDALRSTRHVRVELDGVLLAESRAPVLLFETGLPTRFYVERTAVAWEHLVDSDTQTPCPYKGRTSAYWSVRTADGTAPDDHADLAWSYDYPTAAVVAIAGLVAFYNERVDVVVDGEALRRPRTKFS